MKKRILKLLCFPSILLLSTCSQGRKIDFAESCYFGRDYSINIETTETEKRSVFEIIVGKKNNLRKFSLQYNANNMPLFTSAIDFKGNQRLLCRDDNVMYIVTFRDRSCSEPASGKLDTFIAHAEEKNIMVICPRRKETEERCQFSLPIGYVTGINHDENRNIDLLLDQQQIHAMISFPKKDLGCVRDYVKVFEKQIERDTIGNAYIKDSWRTYNLKDLYKYPVPIQKY